MTDKGRPIPRSELFREYYRTNMGQLYKHLEFCINGRVFKYDIYWGDPAIIFDSSAIRNHSLAVAVTPKWAHDPDPRIFLHEKLTTRFRNAFEMIVAHEIGHMWLYDIVGLTRPESVNCIDETEAEVYADYFSFRFFLKYRGIGTLEQFSGIIDEASACTRYVYGLDPVPGPDSLLAQKKEDLAAFVKNWNVGIERGDVFILQVDNAIDLTLDALGDPFIIPDALS